MKLWDKGKETAALIEEFTVGQDRQLDMEIAAFDLRASIAHVNMLAAVGLLKQEECEQLVGALEELLREVEEGRFSIGREFEDVHSKIEYELTQRLGDTGKKVHTGRSRNDQVLVALHLYCKDHLLKFRQQTRALFDTLLALSDKHRNKYIPGYTHMQMAMPSSVGLWLGGYAELLADDLLLLNAALAVADQNPLGSAAGYGSSLPLDRSHTTRALGLATLKYNATAAMMSRGKLEKTVAFAMASLAATLGRLANDIILYMNENFGFVSFPDELTTGSSIMPHKKNPDVFELVRARANRIQALPAEITLLVNNLTSGYHRDYQLLKEALFPAVTSLRNSLDIMVYMLGNMTIQEDVLAADRYDVLFSVENVNRLVSQGVPFRDAYRQVAAELEAGTFVPLRQLAHRHEGSLGNLCNQAIRQKFNDVYKQVPALKLADCGKD
ncbi:MAG TPA: argininosuccinate lyase [Flammeovirgaceae bacterium]|nr:argininosuccinate lyase [Flammeovirgaceae bacterium]